MQMGQQTCSFEALRIPLHARHPDWHQVSEKATPTERSNERSIQKRLARVAPVCALTVSALLGSVQHSVPLLPVASLSVDCSVAYLAQTVAIKILRSPESEQAASQMADLFSREVTMLAQLSHPNIVQASAPASFLPLRCPFTKFRRIQDLSFSKGTPRPSTLWF